MTVQCLPFLSSLELMKQLTHCTRLATLGSQNVRSVIIRTLSGEPMIAALMLSLICLFYHHCPRYFMVCF